MHLIRRSKPCGVAQSRMGGFTLLEVMVAMFVTAIGLLGIAKIQALAYASTTSASARSLVAIQAAGLAASMHANHAYWFHGLQPTLITISGTNISPTINSAAQTPTYCQQTGSTPPQCTPTNLAAYDLYNWAVALNNMMPASSPVTTISCPVAIPISCVVKVVWNEKAVAVNTQAAANTVQGASDPTTDTFNPTYILYVEP